MAVNSTLKLIVGAIVLSAVLSAYALTPVETHGNLTTSGGYLMDKNGKIVQLRGMSMYWTTSDWKGEKYYTAATVDALVDSWKCSVLRVAYDQKTDGNGSGWNLCKTVVDEAIAKGIYVIIDWHSHTAETQELAAIAFFKTQAQIYKNTPNVIFEPYNEPITSDGTKDGSEATAIKTWAAIKPYLERVTKAIRDAGANNLVILGTPYFAQYVYLAVQDPVLDNKKPFKNVAYTFHFYAASHGKDAYYVKNENPNNLGGMEESFLDRALGVIPIFVTEWGTTNSDGGAGFLYIDEANTNNWFNKRINGKYHLSSCNWSVSDFQPSSAFSSGSTAPSLNPSPSGTIVKKLLTSPTTDTWDPPWILGYAGPSKDVVFTMPGTQPMAQYNRYYGSSFSVEAVSYSNKDKVDKRTAKDTCLKVVSSTATNEWIYYSINSASATKNIIVRYLDPAGTATIDAYVDDVKAGTITFAKNTAWAYAIAPVAVSAGKHQLKLKFTGAVGAGYMLEWFELTNTDTVSVLRQQKQHFAKSAKISTFKNGFSLALPQTHSFFSYSLTSVDGRSVKNQKIESMTTQVNFNNLTNRMWILKLEGAEGVEFYKVVLNNN